MLIYRPLDPAGIVLSKQLPLFLAELYALDKPTGNGSAEIFGLYETTGRLLSLWEELCPGYACLAIPTEHS